MNSGGSASNKNQSRAYFNVDRYEKKARRKEGRSSTDPVCVTHACARLIHGCHTGWHTWVSRHTDSHRTIHPPIFPHFPRTRVAEPVRTQSERHVHAMLPCMHSQEERQPGKDAPLQRYTRIEATLRACGGRADPCTYTRTRARRMMYAPAYQPVAIYKHRRKRIPQWGRARDGAMDQPGRAMKKERWTSPGKERR